jgi:hypothetical protein
MYRIFLDGGLEALHLRSLSVRGRVFSSLAPGIRWWPAHWPGCRYTGSDIVALTPGVRLYDLNAPDLPAIEGHDVALFSGVLEFVHELPRTVRFLAASFRAVSAPMPRFLGARPTNWSTGGTVAGSATSRRPSS